MLDEREYDLSELNDNFRAQFASLTFVDEKLRELKNMHAFFNVQKIVT